MTNATNHEMDECHVLSPSEVEMILDRSEMISPALQTSYDRFVFALCTRMDITTLLSLSGKHFCHQDGKLYLKADPMGDDSSMAHPSEMFEVGNSRLKDICHRYLKDEDSLLFGFIRPIIFSSHLKKIFLTVGISREITIHPKLAAWTAKNCNMVDPQPVAIPQPTKPQYVKVLELV